MSMKICHHDLGTAPRAEIKIVGDLHIGAPSYSGKMLLELKEWLKAKPNRYYIIVGDLFNAALKSSVSDVYSDTMNVDMAMDFFVDNFKSIADKCLGVVDGNHDRRVWKEVGVNPVKYVCSRLEMPYLGHEGNIVLSLGNWRDKRKDGRICPIHYAIYANHGIGGGRLMGGKANAMQRLRNIIVADAYIQGHTHTPMMFTSVLREYSKGYKDITKRIQTFIMTGSALEREGYAEAFAYEDTDNSWAVLILSGTKKMTDFNSGKDI